MRHLEYLQPTSTHPCHESADQVCVTKQMSNFG